MDRRCNNGMCLLMAGAKVASLDLPVANILANPRSDWGMLTHGARVRVARDIEVDWKKYNQSDYLFSHCSIVASVQVKDDGHTIIPACVELVNNNGNAWTNEVLLATFKTFIGGENYLEHLQIESLSKGKILDAVARPVEYKDEKGRKANIFYIDLLVATDRKHDDLVRKITAGELTTMSMGCFCSGTEVVMADGTHKAIEAITSGEEVITHTGEIKRVIRPVETHWFGDIFKIRVKGRHQPIICTGNHRFLVRAINEKCACGCETTLVQNKTNGIMALDTIFANGHKLRILNPSIKYSDEEYSRRKSIIEEARRPRLIWKEAREIRKGDLVVTPSEYYSGDSVSTGLSRLLGLYLAEGNSCNKNAAGECVSVEFSFSISEEQTLARETQNLLMSEMGVKSSRYVRKDRNLCVVRTWKNKAVCDWFVANGGRYSDKKKLSRDVMSWSRESLSALFGGWFDGDGCFMAGKKSSRSIGATASKDLADQILLILSRIGIHSACHKKLAMVDKNGVAHKDSYHIRIGTTEWPKISPFTSRWRDVASPRGWRTFFNCCHAEGYQYFSVDSVEKIRGIDDPTNLDMPVYCLEVEDNHSFLVGGGVAVENCIANEVTCSKCGKVMGDDDPNCKHLDDEMLHPYTDDDGDETVVAELCGRMIKKNGKWEGDPKSVKFIEASWVAKPAFYGAVLNHYVSEIPKEAARVLAFSTARLNESVADMFRMRVADKMGMITLRVACEELARRKRESMIERIIQ